MTAPHTTPDAAQAPPPSPGAMPPSRMLATEPPATATAPATESVAAGPEDRVLDESGWDPAAIDEIRKLRRESQRLRERARAAETETETATTRLDSLRRSEVERIAAEHLVDGADVWSAGTTDFTAPGTGEFDPALVVEAAKSLTATKPHLARPATAPPPSDRPVEGLRAGATPADQPTSKPSWASVIRPRTKGLG